MNCFTWRTSRQGSKREQDDFLSSRSSQRTASPAAQGGRGRPTPKIRDGQAAPQSLAQSCCASSGVMVVPSCPPNDRYCPTATRRCKEGNVSKAWQRLFWITEKMGDSFAVWRNERDSGS